MGIGFSLNLDYRLDWKQGNRKINLIFYFSILLHNVRYYCNLQQIHTCNTNLAIYNVALCCVFALQERDH